MGRITGLDQKYFSTNYIGRDKIDEIRLSLTVDPEKGIIPFSPVLYGRNEQGEVDRTMALRGKIPIQVSCFVIGF